MTNPIAQRAVLASQAMGGDKPSVAMALAGSDLSESEIAAVGGFVNGMGTSLVARMARASGVPVSLSAEEQSQLDALGEDYSDLLPEEDDGEPRSFWEKAWDMAGTALSNTGEYLLENPVSDKIFTGFDKVLDTVKLPARLLGDALDTENDDEINDAMRAQGYDPSKSLSYVQFMYNQGDSLFHDLDGIREQYGDEMVDVALDFFADPETFNQRRLDDPNFDAQVGKIMADPDWEKAADLVDRKHISPGRDVARLLLSDNLEEGAAFTAISGALDTVYTIALDPTLILGKGIRLARAADALTGATNVAGLSRFGIARHVATGIDRGFHGYFRGGIDKTAPEDSLRALFATHADDPKRGKTQIGRHVQQFLDRAAAHKAAVEAGNVDEAAKIYDQMRRLHEPLMPLLDEINGYARATTPLPDGAQRSSEWAIISDANGVGWEADRPSLAQAQHEQRMNEMRDNIKDLRRQVKEDQAFRERWKGKKAPADVPRPPGGWRGELQRKQALADLEAELDGFVVPERFRRGVKPITNLDEFAEFMVSTNGMLRLGHGFGAATRPVMPGRISARKRISAYLRGVMPVFDHTKLGRDLPHESEEALQAALDDVERATDLTPEQKGERMRELVQTHKPLVGGWRGVRARHDQRVRRLATLLPSVSFLDLHSAAHAEQVRRFARLYLSRAEADRLAAMWVAGKPKERRAIARGMLEQTFHASGLSLSEQGRAFWNKFRADAEELDRQSYGYGDTDVIQTERGKAHVALYPSQLSSRVLLPSFRELQYAASKYNAASWLSRNVGARFFSDNTDAAMTAIKMGWITTPAGGLRNALDELAGVGLRGDLPQVLKFRARYSAANKARKAEIRRAGKAYRQLVRDHGKEGAEEELAKRLKAAEATNDPEQIRAAILEARHQHAIAGIFRGIADTVDDVLWAKLATRFLSAVGRAPDADESRYLEDLLEAQRAGEVSHVISDTYYADDVAGTVDFDGPKEMMRSGLMPQRYQFRKTGYEEVEIDGGVGIDSWAANLGARFGDPNSPAHIALIGMWERTGPTGISEEQLDEVVAEVKDYLENAPEIRYFVENAEVTDLKRDPNALEDAARRIVADTKLAVTGRGRPEFDPALVDEVRNHITRNSPRAQRDNAPRELPTLPEFTQAAMRGEYEGIDESTIDDLRRLTDASTADIESRYAAKQDEYDAARIEYNTLREHGEQSPEYIAGLGMPEGLGPELSELRRKMHELEDDLENLREMVDSPESQTAFLTDEVREAAGTAMFQLLSHEIDQGRSIFHLNDNEQWVEIATREMFDDYMDQLRREFGSPQELMHELAYPNLWRLSPPPKKTPFDKIWDSALHRTWDGSGSQTREVQVIDRDGVLHASIHDFGPGGKSQEVPVEYVYRVVSREDYARMKREGVVDTNGRASHGTYDDPEGHDRPQMFGAIVPTQIAKTYGYANGTGKEPVLLKIKYRPEDGWYKSMDDGNSSFVATRNQIPFSQVEDAAPFHVDYDHANPRLSEVRGVDPGFQGHIDDRMIRKYLKEQKGIQLQPGDYGNGVISGDLAEMLINGLEVPSRDFLAQLPEHYRPLHAMKERFAPVLPTGVTGRIGQNWTEFLAKGYKKVVSDQVQALVRNPLLAAKYTEARKTVEPYRNQLVASGWNEEAADAVAHRMALAHSEQEVFKHIDNPTVASQFSVLARNFWAFERAQEDWVRRWGRNLRDDPTIIRKGQLGVHGAESAGILHEDSDGNLVFTYPGSGALIQALTKILPGDTINAPVVPDLSSRLTFVNPSLDNPVGFSATPVISIPFRAIAATFGADYPILMSGMDKVVNGELGANREWYEQMLPTPINRILSGVIREDPDSQFGAAFMQAVAQLEAAGAMDDINSPEEAQQLYDTLRSQIENNMIGRALFGVWAPAAPSLPENAVKGGKATDADWSFHQQGMASLKDEARMILSKLPYEQAMEWWARNHPGESVLMAMPTTKMGELAIGAQAPSTLSAAAWMEDNPDLLRDYPGVGVYFMPQGKEGTPGSEFSMVAYNAQLEQGIRQKKELREFLNDVIVKRGEKIYYDTKDDYDEAIANAQNAGDARVVDMLESQWAEEKARIEATNPLFAAKNASFAENELLRQQQLISLGRMMNDPRAAKAIGTQALGVERMADAYASYKQATEELSGRRGPKVQQQRAQLRAQYESVIKSVTEEFPGLGDLARGVFRIPS